MQLINWIEDWAVLICVMSELHNIDRLEPIVDVNLHIFKQPAYYFNFIDKNIY